ncbi:MAG: V-type ATPase subunit [Candidatus Syntropharchaeia archaeon]
MFGDGILIFLLIVVSIALLSILIRRSLREIVPYLYLNARISAKEGRCIKPVELEEMITSPSVEDMLSVLEGTEYGKYIQNSLERGLNAYFGELHAEIFEIIPKKVKKAFTFLIRKWDVYNIKTILRCIYAGESPPEPIPVGEIEEEKMREIAESSDIEEVVSLIKDHYDLTQAFEKYKNSKNLLFLEGAIDRIFMEETLKKILQTKKKELWVLRDYFTTLIDLTNLKIFLRAKIDGVKIKDIEEFLIEGGTISERLIKNFDDLEFEEIASQLEETPYYHLLIDNIEEYEKAFDEFRIRMGKEISTTHPFGIAPLIGFFCKKEEEIRNIRAIYRAKEAGLLPEEIRKLVFVYG